MSSKIFRLAIVSIFALSLLVLQCGIGFSELQNPDLPDRKGVKVLDKALIHSAFRIDEMIESNIYLKNTDRRTDSITMFNPSVGLEIPFYDNSFSADYDVGMFVYGIHRTEDHIDQRARAMAEINFNDFVFSITDVFRMYTDRAADEDTNRIKRTTNNVRPGITAEFDKLGFDFGYTNRIETYDTNDLIYQTITYDDRDRMSHIFDVTASYRFLPKTYALVENDFGIVDYYNCGEVPGSWFYEGLAGIKGEWFSKADINFRAGFRYQQYEDSNMYANKAYLGPVMRGGFNYYPTDIDTVSVQLERTVFESTYSNMNFYDVTLADVKYQHKFTDKVTAGVKGAYQINQYPTSTTVNGENGKRYDNFYTLGTYIRYDIRRWISVEARYDYKQKVSKFDTYDYLDNLVTFRGAIGF